MAKSTPGTSASKGSAQTIPNKRFRPLPIFNPQPRPPMNQFYGSGASNFYRRPNYSYGVPTGLGALLSGQQSPFGRMVDPATGFARRSFPRPVMGRQDFGRIGRGKTGVGGARTVNPGSQAVVDEYNRNPDPTLGASLPPPTYGTVTGLPSGLTAEQARLRQEELASRRGGGFSRLAPGNVQVSDLFMDAVGRVPTFANNPPQTSVRQYTGSPAPMMDASQRLREANANIGFGSVRPNIRPTMSVGKATGGPVGIHSGIASLVGRR